jgi:hypothetical protein
LTELTEAQIQRAVFDNLRKRGMPDAVFWAVHNSPGARRMAGYLEGVPDVHIVHGGRFYAIELKKDGGRPTEPQLAVVSRINAAGGFSVVAEGLQKALYILEAWNIIRPEHNHNSGAE